LVLELDAHVGYRRPNIVYEESFDEDDISDYVKWRLFLARQLALLKYKQKWTA